MNFEAERNLRQLGQRYELNLAGVKCWTPYWINWNEAPYHLDAPYRGKGTPGQIRAAAKHVLARRGGAPTTAEAMRQLLREQGLGVDCSGFVYYVLDRHLRWRSGRSLASQLRVDRAEIEAALRRHPERAALELPAGDWLPLDQVCRAWRKDPVMITDVRRLTDPRVNRPVTAARDVRPGDLIHMTSPYGPHVAIVCGVTDQAIEYMASEDEVGGLGGVHTRTIRVVRSELGLEHQDWAQCRIYAPSSNGDGVWRPAALEQA